MLLTLYVIFSNQGESAVWGTLAVCERRPARWQSGKQPRTSPRNPPRRPPGRSPRSWPRGRADWSPGWWQGFPPSPGLSECFVVPFTLLHITQWWSQITMLQYCVQVGAQGLPQEIQAVLLPSTFAQPRTSQGEILFVLQDFSADQILGQMRHITY